MTHQEVRVTILEADSGVFEVEGSCRDGRPTGTFRFRGKIGTLKYRGDLASIVVYRVESDGNKRPASFAIRHRSAKGAEKTAWSTQEVVEWHPPQSIAKPRRQIQL